MSSTVAKTIPHKHRHDGEEQGKDHFMKPRGLPHVEVTQLCEEFLFVFHSLARSTREKGLEKVRWDEKNLDSHNKIELYQPINSRKCPKAVLYIYILTSLGDSMRMPKRCRSCGSAAVCVCMCWPCNPSASPNTDRSPQICRTGNPH